MDTPLTGRSLPRVEDDRFLTGRATYVADLEPDGVLHAVVLRSGHAHADFTVTDIDVALSVPGVVGVHLAADLAADGLGPLPCGVGFGPGDDPVVPDRFALAPGRVRHVGEPIALVVAESRETAVDAADLIEVSWQPLDAVAAPGDAIAPGAVRIWEQAPGNVAYRFHRGDAAATDTAFRAADHVVEVEIVNSRVMAAPLEPRAGLASVDPGSGVMHLACTGQGVHELRNELADAVFGLPREQVRVSAPDVGGGFGMKNFLCPEWVLLLWAARRHARPVKWVADRGEDFAGAVHGRAVAGTGALALDADGRFLALRSRMLADMGAYLSAGGPNASTLSMARAMGGVYDIAAIDMETTGVFTNTVPVDAYRGAGKPEANFLIERLVELAARRCGFDVVDLRRRNAIRHFPHRAALGSVLDSGRFVENLDDAVRYGDRDGFEERRAASARAGRLRGLGIACFLETAGGNLTEGAEVRFTATGRVELRVGTESNGQGHATAYRQIAADRLGVGIGDIDYQQADTAVTRMGFGHGGARSMHMGGGTMVLALEQALATAHGVAATLLQAEPASVEFANGRFASGGRSVGLAEVASAARDPEIAPDLAGVGLDTFAKREDAPRTYPNGCHLAEVEVDPDTGAVTLERYLMVDDYGTLINPMLTEGQVHGGVTQGIGQALGEAAVYDAESGQLLAGSLMDYWMPRARDLPRFETTLEGVPTGANRLGVKGSGQAGCIASTQTVVNAVLDALAPLGIDHLQMPLNSETVWRAIRAARPR